MPYVNLVHLRELACARCGQVLAQAGARSFVVDAQGNPLNVAQDEGRSQLAVMLTCRNGHATGLSVPDDVAAEEALVTPDDAPIGADARLV